MKVRPAAGQHDRLHFRIGDGALDALKDAAPGRSSRLGGVHRRIVDRDDGDDVITLELDHFVHATLPWLSRFDEFRTAEFNSTS